MTVTGAMGKQAAVAKPVQVLSLNPPTSLTFRGDFREVVNVELSLTNTTQRRVIFKVKTNYPHRYFVRPNGGLIEPTQRQTVTIMLQPLEHNADEMKLHKFMVQSIFAPDGPINNGLEKLWKGAKPEEIMDTKLRCLFERLLPAATQEVPRYRGKELEGNGVSTTSADPLSSSSKEDAKATGSTATVIIFVIFIIICLLVFGYLKSK